MHLKKFAIDYKKYKMKKNIVILLISLWIFSYLFLFYYNIYISDKNKIEKFNLNNWEYLKKLENEIKEIENEKKSLLLNEEIDKIKNWTKINLWTFIYDENEIFEKIKKEYLSFKYQKIKDNVLIREESKKIFWQTLQLKIENIDLNVNLFSLQNQDISDENIIKEVENKLIKWAVRYPNKDILEEWITLIYWHSSQSIWSKINYSFFRKIPLLLNWQDILISSEEKDYNYKIIESKEINVSEISNYQKKYDEIWIKEWKKYIMLITCYPLDLTEKRWIVIWEMK